jgi:hypothetical protein
MDQTGRGQRVSTDRHVDELDLPVAPKRVDAPSLENGMFGRRTIRGSRTPGEEALMRRGHSRFASGVLCLFLSQRFQRAAPGDDLVEHGVDRLLLLGSRLEDAEVLEVREE